MEYRLKSVVFPLIIITTIVFIIQFFNRGFTELFLLDSAGVLRRPWILITHIFLHANPYHLFLNMWVLFMFGPLLEEKIGPNRFLLFYILSGIAAGFIASFFYSKSLGASGAIMALIGVLIILMPNLQVLFFYFVPTPLWVAGIIFAVIDLMGVVYPSGVGNVAHLSGMGLGLLYGIYLKRQKSSFQKKFSKKKHLEEVDVNEYLKSGRI